MGTDFVYTPLENDLKKIMEIVRTGRYRDVNSFIDNALKMIIQWEEDPVRVMSQIDPSMFTKKQIEALKVFWKDEEVEKFFPKDGSYEEARREAFARRNDNHLDLREKASDTSKYLANLRFEEPDTPVTYDGNPLLFSFYSRFLPARISLAVLGDMLRESNSWSVKLNDLRPRAFDIAEEIGEKLTRIDLDHGRDKWLSTGLPKKKKSSTEEEDITKKAGVLKRFCDQFVGRFRKDRDTGNVYLEGALSALGLIRGFVSDGDERVYLTPDGVKLCQLENPVIADDSPSKSLSDEESNMIFEELLPKLALEYEFVNTALVTVKKFEKSGGRTGDITAVLDVEFLKKHAEFVQKHPGLVEKFGLNHLKILDDKATKNKIVGWRVATMGRLSELGKVVWTIEKNESIYRTA